MDVAITELEKIDADRIDGVDKPANGIPILLLKAVAKGARDCPKCDKSYDADHQGSTCENCGTTLPDADASKAADDKVNCPTCDGDGKIMDDKRDCPDCGASGKVTPAKAKSLAAKSLAKAILADLAAIAKAVGADGAVDEKPDIDKGNQILAMLGEAIAAEAQEMASGQAGEADDIMELACAAQAVRCWRDGEQAVSLGDVMPASMLMQSAAEKADMSTSSINDLPDSAFAYIEPGGSKDEDGKTTPRSKRHFPVHDKAHADNAAARIAQGAEFGDKAKAKVAAAQRKFGEKDDAAKAQIAKDGTDVDTVQQGSDDLDKAVADAIAKATAPLEKLRAELEATLAKVKATPVPWGPVQNAGARLSKPGPSREDVAKEAQYFRAMADSLTADPAAAESYRRKARELDRQAATLA